jgi:hypothetical protein
VHKKLNAFICWNNQDPSIFALKKGRIKNPPFKINPLLLISENVCGNDRGRRFCQQLFVISAEAVLSSKMIWKVANESRLGSNRDIKH